MAVLEGMGWSRKQWVARAPFPLTPAQWLPKPATSQFPHTRRTLRVMWSLRERFRRKGISRFVPMNRPEVRRLMEREPSRLAARQRRETRASLLTQGFPPAAGRDGPRSNRGRFMGREQHPPRWLHVCARGCANQQSKMVHPLPKGEGRGEGEGNVK